MELVGRNGSRLLFVDDDTAAIVDEATNTVVASGYTAELRSKEPWSSDDLSAPRSAFDLAASAVSSLDIRVVTASGRMYTIPKGVQAEAKRALEWRKEFKRGGTPVGMNTARTLARGGQIGIEKIRHIAKYFPRHEIDKKAKGYEPGEEGFPSRGRIAWALWGGDAAWRWSKAIVERENKRAITSGGYPGIDLFDDGSEYALATDYDADVDPFKLAFELDEDAAPEFVARVRLDGTGIDRLYMVNEAGEVLLWDDGCWTQFATVDGDPLGYDRMLDDPYDRCEKMHVVIDPLAAVTISAHLQQNPFTPVSVYDLDADEATLVENAMPEVDWELADLVTVTAAGETGIKVSDGDGSYTPEERSKKASQQVRDRTGRFAKNGSRVTITGDTSGRSGNISSINPDDKTVTVKFDDGSSATVPASQTGPVDEEGAPAPSARPQIIDDSPLDLRGIVAEPRAPIDQPVASLPNRLPPLTSNDLQLLLSDWPSWVSDQRKKYDENRVEEQIDGDETRYYDDPKKKDSGYEPQKVQNAYNHPMLRDWLDERQKGKGGKHVYPNRSWYNPILVDPEIVEDKKPRKAVYASGEPEGDENKKTAPVEKGEALTPETSDVAPLYMAIVAADDPRAVMELVSLVPATSTSLEPATFKRLNGEWVADEKILRDLNSPTPPPVIVLDDPTLEDVLKQVDGDAALTAALEQMRDAMLMPLWGSRGEIVALVSAGGLDRNRGNAEKLRRYWLYGKGAAKIRWNTPGDWTRCVRYLAKYMGPRAKGYCALRHKEATGLWTGDKLHRQMYGRNKGMFSTDVIHTEDEVTFTTALNAQARAAKDRVLMAGGAQRGDGAKFCIPLVIPEDMESGDGRSFEPNSIEIRELPLPLMWQIKTADGHEGSVVVGRIDTMERVENGIGNAYGVFDTGAYGREAERLVREGFIRGVSADLDQFEAKQGQSEAGDDSEDRIGGDKIRIHKARVMAVTLVPKPAFQECSIQLVEDENEQPEQATEEEGDVIPDGVYVEQVDPSEAAAIVACGMIAGAIPVVPPRDWFDNPALDKPTALTVTDEGRVYGHIAAWHVDHIGMAFGTRPPRSKSKYAYFHTGVLRAENGEDIPVGQLTLAGGHAALEASAEQAVRHYDDTASAVADVHAGEDQFGIWVAGALRPGVTPEQVRALRASAPSGDWRPIKGNLELVAVCQVNVPGFPIARARVASGQVMALVAAGASTLARLKSDPVADLASRVEKLEQLEHAELSAKIDPIREAFAAAKAERDERLRDKALELSLRVKGEPTYDDEFGGSTAYRMKMAKEGKALPDGSYPISNVEALKDAIQAYGRGKKSKRAQIRRHIMKRARQLDRSDLIPEKWKSMGTFEIDETLTEMRERIAALSPKGSLTAAANNELCDSLNRLLSDTISFYFQAHSAHWIVVGEDFVQYHDLFLKIYEDVYASIDLLAENIRKCGGRPDGTLSGIVQNRQIGDVEQSSDPQTLARALLDANEALIDELKACFTMADAANEQGVADFLAARIDAQQMWRWQLSASLGIDGVDKPEPMAQPEESLEPVVVSAEFAVDDEEMVPAVGESDGEAGGQGKGRYTPETQPRDDSGRFRRVLARLKQDIGDSGLTNIIEKIEEAENNENAGDYERASSSANELIDMIDRIDTGALNPEALENVRSTAAELGKVIANLPLPFGQDAAKVRYSDLPPALKDLIDDMITRVSDKIGEEDAAEATRVLESYKGGGDFMNQSEISSQLSKLLRLLT